MIYSPGLPNLLLNKSNFLKQSRLLLIQKIIRLIPFNSCKICGSFFSDVVSVIANYQMLIHLIKILRRYFCSNKRYVINFNFRTTLWISFCDQWRHSFPDINIWHFLPEAKFDSRLFSNSVSVYYLMLVLTERLSIEMHFVPITRIRFEIGLNEPGEKKQNFYNSPTVLELYAILSLLLSH